MRLFVPKETDPRESRIAMVPLLAKRIASLGAELTMQAGLGEPLGYPDAQYKDAGVTPVADRTEGFARAELVLRLSPPDQADLKALRPGTIHVSYLDPFRRPELLTQLAEAKISAISMEMIPRTTLAQKMDALSSQASLAGYVAVVLAAERLAKIFPMMNTPAGTIAPSRVFVIGAGVAGLQAIATAKRLGARVEAFDTRPVVKEQVESLGAKFLEVDLGETGQTKDGYAKQLTDAQLAKQREAMAEACAQADVVITTAQVFGREAPRILTASMIDGMQPGSVAVDLAVETGGNIEGSKLDEEVVTDRGVRIIGLGNLPGRVAIHASQMYASNLFNLVSHFWRAEKDEQGQDAGPGQFTLDRDDEILQGCLVTHDGAIVHERLRDDHVPQRQTSDAPSESE